MGGGTESLGYESAFVVNVNWNAGHAKWNVNTWNRDVDGWDADNRVFSPETIKFLSAFSREFLFASLCAILRLAYLLPAIPVI